MKFNSLMVLFLLLCGCTTPGDRRLQAPLMFYSVKPVKDVAVCISEMWENVKLPVFLAPPIITSRIAKRGYTIAGTNTFNGVSTNTMLADVEEVNGRVVTKYYKWNGPGLGAYGDSVSACQ